MFTHLYIDLLSAYSISYGEKKAKVAHIIVFVTLKSGHISLCTHQVQDLKTKEKIQRMSGLPVRLAPDAQSRTPAWSRTQRR